MATFFQAPWPCPSSAISISSALTGHFHLLSPHIHRSFHDLSLRFGPIFSLRLGSVPCIVVEMRVVGFQKRTEVTHKKFDVLVEKVISEREELRKM
ncbi:hypothetical protein ACLB2K_041449 [Fragaria x ananassa]